MESLGVAEAARRLGIRPERVRDLIESGNLDARRMGRAWAVDPQSVEAYAAFPRRAGRPLAPARAWALLALAGGREPGWASSSVRAQLQDVLNRRGLVDLVSQLRSRARRHRWYVHQSMLEELMATPGIVVSGAEATGLLRDSGPREVYVTSHGLEQLVERFRPDGNAAEPNLIVREVVGPWPFEPGETVAWPEVAAVDLVDRWDDARARAVSMEILTRD